MGKGTSALVTAWLGLAAVVGADMVTDWNTTALEVMKDNVTHPPKVGRDLAIVHLSIYDALMAVDGTHFPFYTSPSAPTNTSRESAIASAGYHSLKALYPSYTGVLDNALADSLSSIPDGAAKQNGLDLGETVANAIVGWRAGDGWDAVVPYTPGTDPGEWRPTPPGYHPALAPHWGGVTPFAIPDVSAFRPGPPPALTTTEYASALNEVALLGRDNSVTRTSDQTQIAEFWNDFPGPTAAPPGKWNLIAQVLADLEGSTLAGNARMFAMLNVVLGDAGIVSWDAKYTYNLWRPETAIRLADTDNNPGTLADPAWAPTWPSPSFPEYTSGHSTFSGASGEILALFFGTDNIAFEVGAGFDVLPGVLRSYDNISEAALEAGRSRIYGGIHFEFANVAGLSSGADVADYVYGSYFHEVPEPTGLSVLAGLMALLIVRRRRRRTL
ncbi:MAG TPA: phosphatase PAP2 family protein [Planctomycetota bacterium]|nr:phosphatase PAP2 family protein [Planctomycetota bacterium]